MPKHDGVFVPHLECAEASGACFTEGRCLSQCKAQKARSHEHRIKALERQLLRVELELARMKTPNV